MIFSDMLDSALRKKKRPILNGKQNPSSGFHTTEMGRANVIVDYGSEPFMGKANICRRERTQRA